MGHGRSQCCLSDPRPLLWDPCGHPWSCTGPCLTLLLKLTLSSLLKVRGLTSQRPQGLFLLGCLVTAPPRMSCQASFSLAVPSCGRALRSQSCRRNGSGHSGPHLASKSGGVQFGGREQSWLVLQNCTELQGAVTHTCDPRDLRR